MKNVLYFSLFILITGISCQKDCDCNDPDPDPPGCQTDLSKGLLAYYPFNGNFNDESGNGNNATAKNGAALTTDFTGSGNKAAGFDGVNDYLIVPGNSKLNADTFTVSFQVMVNNANRFNAAVCRVNFETVESVIFGVAQSQPTDNFWTYSVVPGTDACSKKYAFDTSMYVPSKGPIQPGRWYNITVSFAGGIQKMYVDGVLEGTKTRSFTTAKKCDNADLVIGGWWKNDVMSIDGKIDEVRLYKRVLTDCEIAKLAEPFKK